MKLKTWRVLRGPVGEERSELVLASACYADDCGVLTFWRSRFLWTPVLVRAFAEWQWTDAEMVGVEMAPRR